MGFTVCLDHPYQGQGQGNSWAIIVPEVPLAASCWEGQTQDFCGVGWRLRKAPKMIQATGVFFISMLQEGFINILKQRRLAVALVCQQVSHLEGQTTSSKGICHTAVRRNFVSLSHFCASEEGTMLKKGSSISSAPVQDSPKKDKYPLKEIQEFSGTGKRF